MPKSVNDDITFLFIEKPAQEPTMEEALLRKTSRRTFSAGRALKTLVSENALGVTAGEILKACDTPLLAISLDSSVYYSEGWVVPLLDTLKKGIELASPASADSFRVEPPYFSPLTFNDASEEMRRLHGDEHIRKTLSEPPALLLFRSSLLGVNPETTLSELFAGLKGAVVPSSLVHRFGDPYASGRKDLLPFLPAEIETALDIGCAEGLLGEAIKREKGCKVFGVELNNRASNIARTKLDGVFCVDVEEADLPFREELDLTIFADVLEHLFDPWRVLEKSLKWLRPGGTVLASLPNVAHYSIITDLLRGRWDYIPYGLLSVSHLRFFTKASTEDMFRESGYSIDSIIPQEFPPRLKDAVIGRLEEFLGTDAMSDEILYPGFYVLARKR